MSEACENLPEGNIGSWEAAMLSKVNRYSTSRMRHFK
jgi:hypothetical protein